MENNSVSGSNQNSEEHFEAVFDSEKRDIREDIPRHRNWMAFLRQIIFIILLVIVIAESFWLSFVLGGKLVKGKLKQQPIETEIAQKEMMVDEPTVITKDVEKKRVVESDILKAKVLPVAVKKPKSKVSVKQEYNKVVVKPRLLVSNKAKEPVVLTTKTETKLYWVQVGVFKSLANAKSYKTELEKAKFEASIQKVGSLWRVFSGAYKNKTSAQNLVNQLKSKSFDAIVVYR